jgi:hypothetical protein
MLGSFVISSRHRDGKIMQAEVVGNVEPFLEK